MNDCQHEHIVDPPPGKVLRVCLDCCKRLIECSWCSATITARTDIASTGWMKSGVSDEKQGGTSAWSWCPSCWYSRRS